MIKFIVALQLFRLLLLYCVTIQVKRYPFIVVVSCCKPGREACEVDSDAFVDYRSVT